MNPEQLLQSVYLGDRACKAVLIDSWNQRVAVQATVISRLKPGTKTWDFYVDADIKDGWLVFSNVRSVRFEPTGPMPNDLINAVSVKAITSPESHTAYLFELSIDSVDNTGNRTEVLVRIEADRVHLEDPREPGVEITT
jgi:hypothetical protein